MPFSYDEGKDVLEVKVPAGDGAERVDVRF